MKLTRSRLAALILSGFTVFAAQADPVGALASKDSTFGIGTLTHDSVSNLDWLDLGLTTSHSYNSITSLFGVGLQFEGYRVATFDEVVDMVQHSGILGTAHGAASQTVWDDFSSLFGTFFIDDVGGQGCVLALQGLVEPGDAGTHSISGVGIHRDAEGAGGCGPVHPGTQYITHDVVAIGLAIDDFTTIADHNSSFPVTVGGIFLVKEAAAVPLPSSLPLAALALSGLPVLRRRRRQES